MAARSDWAIRFEVCDRLVQREDIDVSAVYVSVRDGRVVLFGRVASRHDHDVTLQIASAVRGVRGIDDHLVDAGQMPGARPPKADPELGEEPRRPLR